MKIEIEYDPITTYGFWVKVDGNYKIAYQTMEEAENHVENMIKEIKEKPPRQTLKTWEL